MLLCPVSRDSTLLVLCDSNLSPNKFLEEISHVFIQPLFSRMTEDEGSGAAETRSCMHHAACLFPLLKAFLRVYGWSQHFDDGWWFYLHFCYFDNVCSISASNGFTLYR